MEILMHIVGSDSQALGRCATMFLRYRKRCPVIVGLFSVIFILAPFAVVSNSQTVQKIHPPEYQVKAAFLYKFAIFVDWPAEAFADSTTPITIGVIGEDPFGVYLDQTIEGKTVKGRKLLIKRFKHFQNLKFCHVLFISSTEQKRLKRILKRIESWSVLTVGETERFVKDGGIINFIMKNNKVRFEINASAAERARLKISSKLLRLATNH